MKKDRIGLNRVDSARIGWNRIESARFGSTRITFAKSRFYRNLKYSYSETIFLKYTDLNFQSINMDNFLFRDTNVFFRGFQRFPLVNPNLKLSTFFEQRRLSNIDNIWSSILTNRNVNFKGRRGKLENRILPRIGKMIAGKR